MKRLTEKPKAKVLIIQGLLRIFFASIWAVAVSYVAFIILYNLPLELGGPGSHQAPIMAYAVLPVIFPVTFVLTAIKPFLGRVVFLTTIALCTLVVAYLYVQTAFVVAEYRKTMALRPDERVLLDRPPFDLSVAVDQGRFSPADRDSLIRAFRTRPYFTCVGRIEELEHPDLIARVSGVYYSDKTGYSFTLEWAGKPEEKHQVKAWKWITGPVYGNLNKLYNERLTVNTVKAVDSLLHERNSTKKSTCTYTKQHNANTLDNLFDFNEYKVISTDKPFKSPAGF